MISYKINYNMQKTLCLVLAAVLFVTANSACVSGQFPTGGVRPDSAKGECSPCHPLCKTCTTFGACYTYVDSLKGLDRATTPVTALCSGVSLMGSTVGYNSNNNSCDRCMDGCSSCAVDYNVCTSCYAGWDYDRNGGQCIRATLGLAAVVLALSALTLLIVIITCICACKL